MTNAALERLGERVVGGVVAHPHAIAAPASWPKTIRAIGAGHPFPDEGSLAAGAEAWRLVGQARLGDLVLVLVSGGGSALFEYLRPGVTLADLAALTRDLQRAGADIRELNTVRRALSLVKGGGLAARAGEADVLALLLSDVMGDDPAAIASGPTVPSPTGPADALRVVQARGLAGRYPAIEAALRQPGDPTRPAHSETRIIGSNRMAAEAARDRAASLGFRASLLEMTLSGEARVMGDRLGQAAGELHDSPGTELPACFVVGGETTVTVRGDGRGGRNTELALAAAMALDGKPRVALLSFATDGVDGASDDAGAVVTGDTLPRARALGLSAQDALARNDSATFFEKLGDAVRTGPTGTNVNDLVIVLAYV
jgi:hydroxypyruvate reductase